MRPINYIHSRAGMFAVVSMVIWAAVTSYGEFFNGAPNSACYRFLGCDSGFFGYDALEHFLFGFAIVWVIVWLCDTFPNYSLLSEDYWKTALILISLVALIGIMWEIGECFRDAFLLNIMHEPMLDWRLHINYLAQPTNFDTMGDLTFGLLGALIALPFMSPKLMKNKWKSKTK